MKNELSPEDVFKVYNQLSIDSNQYFKRKQYDKSLKNISVAAYWAYSFNAFYYDEKAELLIKSIGDILYQTNYIYDIKTDKYVFIDSFCYDNRGLTQQYLRALMFLEKEILYIVTSESINLNSEILKELNNYSKSRIILFKTIDGSEHNKIQFCINEIIKYTPERILLHLTPWDYKALLICHAVKGPIKLNINLTDHAFWLGASFIDYNIEFRSYGYTVSLEKRGLKESQLLTLPYYPIKSMYTDFLGFPDIHEKHIKILSGGSLYKMLGKDDIYFKLLDKLLELSDNITILIAGFNESSVFNEKIKNIRNKERIVLIGDRKDIDAVFKNCDIYLGTYPICGGLMSQYAAMHGKPILAYCDENDSMNDIGGIINNYGSPFKCHSNIEDFLAYAERIINIKELRIEEGKKLKQALMTENKFNIEFSSLMVSLNNKWKWGKVKIDYQSFFIHYLDLENKQTSNAIKSLVINLKIRVLFVYSWLLSLTLPIIIEQCKRKIFHFCRFNN